jgi:hypothetical protein
MAFKKENLSCISSNASPTCVREYTYWNEGGDTVTAGGFIPNSINVKPLDLIKVIAAANDAYPEYYRVTQAGGVNTLVNIPIVHPEGS